MHEARLKEAWLREENAAHMLGWDFSHLRGRYKEDTRLPWDYRTIVLAHLKSHTHLLDMGTGGGEFLLTLKYPHSLTTVTEAYPPNIRLCQERLAPLGTAVVPVTDDAHLPLPDAAFDLIINRHEAYDPAEIFRLLKPGGLFITQQVGEENDRELAELLLPERPFPFPGLNAREQAQRFRDAGFTVLEAEEAFCPICFYDVGALVWFARILPWEFPGFSVDGCFFQLLEAQRRLDAQGVIEGHTHRFLLVAQKP